MRDISEVINKILLLVPQGQGELIRALSSILESVAFAPPELMGLQWERLTVAMNRHIPRPPTEQWHAEAVAELTTLTVEQVWKEFGEGSPETSLDPLGVGASWYKFDEVEAVVRDAIAGRWSWFSNTSCKYIELRIDMRDGHCLIKDREGNLIALDRLRMQHGRASQNDAAAEQPTGSS